MKKANIKKKFSMLLTAFLLLQSFTVMAEEKQLTVAVNAGFEPFEYYDEKGNLSGFDIDLMQYLGETSGYQVNFVETDFAELLNSVITRRVDCAISAISVTEQRSNLVQFSAPYLQVNISYQDDFSQSTESERYAIAFAKENTELANVLGTALVRADENGVIADLIEMYEINTLSDTEQYDYEFTPMPKQSITVASTEDGLKIGINETEIAFSAPPFVDEQNRTQVPMREICESLGLGVLWDATTQTVTVDSYGNAYAFRIGQNSYLKNGTEIPMDTSACIYESRTYLPLRYLAEILGYEIVFMASEAEEIVAEPAPQEEEKIFVDTFYTDAGYQLMGRLLSLARTEAYQKLAASPENVMQEFHNIIGADYEKATEIYRFTICEDVAENHIRQQYALPEDFSFALLKETGRYPLSVFANLINAQAGVETLAATAMLKSGSGYLMPADFTGDFALYYRFESGYSAWVSYTKTGEGVIGISVDFIRNMPEVDLEDIFAEWLGTDGFRFEKIA